MNASTAPSLRLWRLLWLPLLVVLAGLAVTESAWRHSVQDDQQRIQAYFDYRVRETQARILERLQAYEQVLLGTQGLFQKDPALSDKELAAYVAHLDLGTRYPGIQGVGYAASFPAPQRAAHVARIRAAGDPAYRIHPEGARLVYSAISMLEPRTDRNLRALGYDMLTEPVRREAMARARDTGRPALSGKVTLIQETGQDLQAGFLLYLPHYRTFPPPATVETRRQALVGWVYAPFRAGDFIRGVLGEGRGQLDIEVFDGPTPSPETLLFDRTPAPPAQGLERLRQASPIRFSQHQWTLVVQALPGLMQHQGPSRSGVALGLGVLGSLLLGTLTLVLVQARGRAQARADQGEARYRQILEIAPNGILILDPEGRILEANRMALDITGYPWVQIHLRTLRSLVSPVAGPEVEVALAQLAGKGRAAFEGALYTKGGDRRVVAANLVLLPGEAAQALAILRDVTTQRAAEQALRESEANFRQFFETLEDLVFVTSPEGTIRYANPAATQKLGYQAGDFTDRPLLELHPAPLRQEAEAIFGAMVRGEQSHCPLPLETREGRLLKVDTRIWMGKWNGEPCIYGICKDLTAEEEARQLFDRIFRANPAPMAVSGPDHRFVEVNQAFLDTLGYTREEVLGRTSGELHLFEDPEAHRRAGETLTREGRLPGLELQLRRKDGDLLTGLFSGEIISSQGATHFLTVMIDYTAQKAAEGALREREAQLRAIFDHAPIGIGRSDLQGRLTDANPAFLRILGRTREELIGRSFLQFTDSEHAERDRHLHGGFVSGAPPAPMETRWVRGDGTSVPVSLSVQPVLDASGQPLFMFGMVEDISERHRFQETLEAMNHDLHQRVREEVARNREMDRMLMAQARHAAMGEMVGNIAHQWRQPLGALSMVISNLRDTHRRGELTPEAMEQARADCNRLIQRMSATIHDFLNFFRREKSPSVFTVQRVVEESLALVRANLLAQQISVEVSGTDFQMKGSPNELSQVLLNLLSNAKDAILEARPSGGKIHIGLRIEGEEGVIQVADDGPGIPEAALEQVFDPYFSTKASGTGIGLYMSKTLVEQGFGGRICAGNGPTGAVFTLRFPPFGDGRETRP